MVDDDNESVASTQVNEKITTLKDVAVIGTQNYAIHYSCQKCNARLTDTKNDLTKCMNCRLVQLSKSCPYEVGINLYIYDENNDKKVMVTACTSIIKKIVSLADEEDLRMDDLEMFLLTSCPLLTISYNEESGIIRTVEITED